MPQGKDTPPPPKAANLAESVCSLRATSRSHTAGSSPRGIPIRGIGTPAADKATEPDVHQSYPGSYVKGKAQRST